MSAERTEIEQLAEAGSRLCERPVEHPLFKEVRAALEAALASYKLVLLTGVSGAGKTAVIEALAGDMNAPIVEDRKRLHAVVLETLSPSHNRFPWRDQLEAILDALEDPLPGRKIDREAYADSLDPKKRGVNASAPAPRPAYSSEPSLRKAVRDAARSSRASSSSCWTRRSISLKGSGAARCPSSFGCFATCAAGSSFVLCSFRRSTSWLSPSCRPS